MLSTVDTALVCEMLTGLVPGPDPNPAQVGPSPAIMHVSNLKKLAPLWYELSVQMKADREADGAFGWMLEMWGYSVAALRVGIKHFAWQQIQIEPQSAAFTPADSGFLDP